ncbi:MAG: NAD(P)-dependent oxidoreductase [Anaerolineales bacterium]
MGKQKIFVTGGAGFLGSYIAASLGEKGIPAVLYDAFIRYYPIVETESELHQLYMRKRFKLLKKDTLMLRGDTRARDHLRRVILEHRPTHIIHLAALPLANLSNIYTEEAVDSILNSTVNLLEIIRDVDFVERFVFTSSSMIYGDFQYLPADEEHPKNPKNIYGGAKFAGEVMTRAFGERYGIEYTIVRPSAVYGPTDVNQRVSQIFVENALLGHPLVLRGADSALDFSYVEDVAEGFVQAALEPHGANQVMNLTRGEGRTLREFADILKKMVPSLEVIEEEVDKDIPMRGALDISRAQELIKFNPQHSLEKGLEKYVAFVRECMDELEVK